mgnify:CR=1 FL=1
MFLISSYVNGFTLIVYALDLIGIINPLTLLTKNIILHVVEYYSINLRNAYYANIDNLSAS